MAKKSSSNSKTAAAGAVENTAPVAASTKMSGQALRKLVICAYHGTEDRMEKVWRKMTGISSLIIAVDQEQPLLDIIADVIASPEVDGDFILVPANCVPCSPISLDELAGPFVFVDVSGRRHYSDRLPLPLNKDLLVDELVAQDEVDSEAFMATYFRNHLHRPIEGGFRFGNLVTPVYRANPCENLVIEAFVRKKFVTASPEGFEAIAVLVDQYLLG